MADKEEIKDLTEERRKRCSPIIVDLLQKMLDSGLYFNDLPYIEQRLKEHLEMFLRNLVLENVGEIFQTAHRTLEKHFKDATEKLWDKDIDEITVEDIDKALKKK